MIRSAFSVCNNILTNYDISVVISTDDHSPFLRQIFIKFLLHIYTVNELCYIYYVFL